MTKYILLYSFAGTLGCPARVGRACLVLIAILVSATSAAADKLPDLTLDQLVARVTGRDGATGTVIVTRDHRDYKATLPVFLANGDVLTVEQGMSVHVTTATETFDLPHDGLREWKAPVSPRPKDGRMAAFFGTLWHGVSAPIQKIAFAGVNRSGSECPEASAAPRSTLVPLSVLTEPKQQIGADLRHLMVIWKPSLPPRSVVVKLVRESGGEVAEAATCTKNNAVLNLRSNDIHADDRLRLLITDTDGGGSIEYHISVVPPASLPQPPVVVPDEWLAATWRLQSGAAAFALDSVTRVAKASANTFGAQAVLGAIASELPL